MGSWAPIRAVVVLGTILSFLLPVKATGRSGFVVPHRLFGSSASSANWRQYASTLERSEVATEGGGMGRVLLDWALDSPLWKWVLVPMARLNMEKSAESSGVPWASCREWIMQQDGRWHSDSDLDGQNGVAIPEYYRRDFHSYDNGNLSWKAAWEQEIAGRAVGVRNFPRGKPSGEEAFRRAFDVALDQAGATVPEGASIVDFGCATGVSTRRLAANWPQANSIVGYDLSPFYLEVGRLLLKLAPTAYDDEDRPGDWVHTIVQDSRMELVQADIQNCGLPDESIDVVHIGLVVHELPPSIARDIACREAFRILKPGGQLWLSEMDFESPGFTKLRSNPLLFSLIRSTEPYLDVYADSARDLRKAIADTYDTVHVAAATGRHFALVATKPKAGVAPRKLYHDSRFRPDGSYAVDDTHLPAWKVSD